jgi:hypothetical protein
MIAIIGDIQLLLSSIAHDSKRLCKVDVWDRLVTDSRAAALRTLSADYLASLLQALDRTLTSKEVVHSFCKESHLPARSIDRRNPPGDLRADQRWLGR